MSFAAFREFEHGFWDVTAEPYDVGFGHVTSQTLPALFDILNLPEGAALLDVACGPGYVAGEAARRGMDVTGVDFSRAMIDLAGLKYPDATFQVADATDLPFDDESFDGVTCNFGLLHFSEADKAIAEARRVCKPGGHYVCAVWNVLAQNPAMALIMDAVSRHITVKPDMPEGPDFFAFSEPSFAKTVFEGAGFQNFQHQVLPATWPIQSGRSFMQYFADGGARIGAILRAQDQETIDAIVADIDENLQPYKDGEHYSVPVSIVLLSGAK